MISEIFFYPASRHFVRQISLVLGFEHTKREYDTVAPVGEAVSLEPLGVTELVGEAAHEFSTYIRVRIWV